MTIDGTSPATTLPTVVLSGGTLAGARNRTITTLDARSGIVQGAGITTVSTAFAKTTAGQLGVQSGPLVLNVDSTWASGDICVQNGGILRLPRTFTIADTAGAMPCSGGGAQVDVASPNRHHRACDLRHDDDRDAGRRPRPDRAARNGRRLHDDRRPDDRRRRAPGIRLDRRLGRERVRNSSARHVAGRLVAGNYAQGAAGTLEIEVNGATAGTEHDVVNVNGAASLGGTLAILNGGGFDPPPNTTLQILTASSRTGTFGTVTGATITGAKHYAVAYPASPIVQLVIDALPPVVAAHPPVVAPPQPGKTTAAVTYANPTATDNVDAVSVICTPASGSVFRTGVTGVACSATDTSGNVGTGAFTVTVKRCVKNGTRRADRLNGTAARDGICGLAGNDKIKGLGGDDVLDGGAGNHTVTGGAGVDELVGGAGDDTIDGRGDRKRDIVKCGSGRHDVALVDRLDKVARDCETVRRR